MKRVLFVDPSTHGFALLARRLSSAWECVVTREPDSVRERARGCAAVVVMLPLDAEAAVALFARVYEATRLPLLVVAPASLSTLRFEGLASVLAGPVSAQHVELELFRLAGRVAA